MNPWVVKSMCNKYTDLAALGLTNVTVNDTTITFTLRDGQTASVTIPTPEANKKFTEDINIESSIWTINHGLNTPWQELTVTSYDHTGRPIIGEIDVDRSTNNLLVINFLEKVKGKIIVKQ